MGDGDIGSGKGDLGAPCAAVVPGTVRESLGLVARSMPMVEEEDWGSWKSVVDRT